MAPFLAAIVHSAQRSSVAMLLSANPCMLMPLHAGRRGGGIASISFTCKVLRGILSFDHAGLPRHAIEVIMMSPARERFGHIKQSHTCSAASLARRAFSRSCSFAMRCASCFASRSASCCCRSLSRRSCRACSLCKEMQAALSTDTRPMVRQPAGHVVGIDIGCIWEDGDSVAVRKLDR